MRRTRVPLHRVDSYCTRLETFQGRPAPNSNIFLKQELTNHARMRGDQRAVKVDQIAYVIEHGKREHVCGALCYFFGRKEVRRAKNACPHWLERLEGVTVMVTSDDSRILTVYRNRNAPKNLKKKAA